MLKVLLGNDFGGGSGHSMALRHVADRIRLIRPDVEFLFGLGAGTVRKHFGLRPSESLDAPLMPALTADVDMVGATTFGNRLARRLLANPEEVLAGFAGWSMAIASFKPDVAIADYAPCLNLAARGRVPLVVIGSGYTLPPPELPHFLPLYDSWSSDIGEELRQVEMLNVMLGKCSLAPLSRLPEINAGDAYGLMTIPAFDLYARVRQQPYLGVLHPGGAPLPVGAGYGSFSYFSNLPSQETATFIASELAASGISGEAYIAGYSAAELNLLASGIICRQTMVNLSQCLPDKAVIVHKGSLGMASAALYAGVPQIILYVHDENWANGIAAMHCGVGAAVELNSLKRGELSQAIRGVAADAGLRAKVLTQAEKHSSLRDADPAAKIAEIALATSGL